MTYSASRLILMSALLVTGFGTGSSRAASTPQADRARGSNELYDGLVRARKLDAPKKGAVPTGINADRVDNLKRSTRDARVGDAMRSEASEAERAKSDVRIVERNTVLGTGSPAVGGGRKRTGSRGRADLSGLEDNPAVGRTNESGGQRSGKGRARKSRASSSPSEPEPVLDATGLEPVMDFSRGK